MPAKLIGQCFGRLTVLRQAPSRNGHRYWLCRCECGGTCFPTTGGLRSGKTRSCGCLKREPTTSGKLVHGETRRRQGASPEYNVWRSMRERCYNPKNISYRNYGGRGLQVSPRWRNSYELFLKDVVEDIGRRPSPKHSIDRIRNDGDYERGNVRWVTREVQRRNSRRIIQVRIGDKIVCLKDACDLCSVSYTLVRGRIRCGWPIEKALATPKIPTARWG